MTKPHLARRSSSLRIPVILIALIGTLYFARDILIPLALAVTLALILTPAVTRLVKLHVGRAFAALAVVVITLVTVGGFGVVIFNQLIQVLDELPGYQENIHNKIQAMRAPAKGPLGRATENVRELGKELSNTQTPVAPPPQQQQQRDQPIRRSAPAEPGRPLPVQIVTEPANELQYLRDLTRPFLAPLGTLGIVIVFTLYLLIEQHDLRDRLFRLAGLSRMNLVTQALDDATRRVSRYLMLQFLVNACFGVSVRTRIVFHRPSLRRFMGGCRRDLSHNPLRRVDHRRAASADSVAGGIRYMEAAGPGVYHVRGPGTVDRQPG